VIDWLIQSTAGHPALARGIAPAGLLSEQEQIRLAELKIVKRRSDWLIGRWTAKHLLQSYIERRTGIRPQIDTLTVVNDPDGAPRAIAERPKSTRLQIADNRYNLQSAICNLQLSISHCDGYAFCALSDARDVAIGVDIERVERRSAPFAEDYFTDNELTQVRAAEQADKDIIMTLIWSAKESALKTLRLGLTVDTRSVACSINAAEQADGWASVDIVCDRRRLGLSVAPVLTGWWRTMDGYVLTVAATRA
jgi:4'-phosphopantetheinyl transferase